MQRTRNPRIPVPVRLSLSTPLFVREDWCCLIGYLVSFREGDLNHVAAGVCAPRIPTQQAKIIRGAAATCVTTGINRHVCKNGKVSHWTNPERHNGIRERWKMFLTVTSAKVPLLSQPFWQLHGIWLEILIPPRNWHKAEIRVDAQKTYEGKNEADFCFSPGMCQQCLYSSPVTLLC